jgi:hypothetical protein
VRGRDDAELAVDAELANEELGADPGAAGATVIDELPELSQEERAGLVAAGLYAEGLLQGLPTTCQLAEDLADPDLTAFVGGARRPRGAARAAPRS